MSVQLEPCADWDDEVLWAHQCGEVVALLCKNGMAKSLAASCVEQSRKGICLPDDEYRASAKAGYESMVRVFATMKSKFIIPSDGCKLWGCDDIDQAAQVDLSADALHAAAKDGSWNRVESFVRKWRGKGKAVA